MASIFFGDRGGSKSMYRAALAVVVTRTTSASTAFKEGCWSDAYQTVTDFSEWSMRFTLELRKRGTSRTDRKAWGRRSVPPTISSYLPKKKQVIVCEPSSNGPFLKFLWFWWFCHLIKQIYKVFLGSKYNSGHKAQVKLRDVCTIMSTMTLWVSISDAWCGFVTFPCV